MLLFLECIIFCFAFVYYACRVPALIKLNDCIMFGHGKFENVTSFCLRADICLLVFPNFAHKGKTCDSQASMDNLL